MGNELAGERLEVLDTITVQHGSGERHIDLCVGDLAALQPSDAVDVLVVSALPDDYHPVPGTLIGALAGKGIRLWELADRKQLDLRQTCSCWLSEDLVVADPGIGFKRILCFEPLVRGAPAEVVGDIFRSLLPFLGDDGVKAVAMPVVATGLAKIPVSEMLPPLVEAAVNWMSLGVSLDHLKIVMPHAAPGRPQAESLFAEIKRDREATSLATAPGFDYDLFVSYAHEDGDAVSFILEQIAALDPDVRLYRDRLRLNPGSAWQHELFDALDASRKVLAVYSPAYVNSKVCKEEFNIAWARSRDADDEILVPLYLHKAALPTYMKMLQYIDCRDGSRDLMRDACSQLVATLGASAGGSNASI